MARVGMKGETEGVEGESEVKVRVKGESKGLDGGEGVGSCDSVGPRLG